MAGITGGVTEAMQTKTLTIQLNDEQLPILPVEPEAHLSLTPPQISSGGLNVDENYIHFYDGKMEGAQ